ncbi:MAG: DUF1223 domain-containing protein [Cyclobacteriaceae bacterium]|nr:DUF1223 domain-containing protein [Cyclobacteriaceae bacterium]
MKTMWWMMLALPLINVDWPAPRPRPVVVIELFTTQGCSSCPAADELVREFVDMGVRDNQELYGLSFHVTYWDHLGWKDPYSSATFTERQKLYQQLLSVPQLYTPQVIVNGRHELVGSNPIALRSAIDAAMRETPRYEIKARALATPTAAEVQYTLQRAPGDAVVTVALVDKERRNYVPRGENKGLTLVHHDVVRALVVQEAAVDGVVRLELPADFNTGNSAVILYVQQRRTMKVLGATKVAIGEK